MTLTTISKILVFGCKSGKLRERLINVGTTLALDKAKQMVQSMEYVSQQMMTMGHNEKVEVHLV
jgi:hypothetical protein